MQLTKGDSIATKDRDGIVTIEEMKQLAIANEQMMSGDNPAYFVISGIISMIFCGDESNPRPMFYLACQLCKKKVIDEATGYRCERCDKTFKDAVPTYNFGLIIADFTDSHIFSVLGDAGEEILGMPATQFYEIHDNIGMVKDLCNRLQFKEVSMLIRAKLDIGRQQNDGDPLSNVRFVVAKNAGHSSKKDSEMLLKRL